MNITHIYHIIHFLTYTSQNSSQIISKFKKARPYLLKYTRKYRKNIYKSTTIPFNTKKACKIITTIYKLDIVHYDLHVNIVDFILSNNIKNNYVDENRKRKLELITVACKRIIKEDLIMLFKYLDDHSLNLIGLLKLHFCDYWSTINLYVLRARRLMDELLINCGNVDDKVFLDALAEFLCAIYDRNVYIYENFVELLNCQEDYYCFLYKNFF